MQISEVFYSIQGEGLLAGQPSVFIRTSGCNLRCRWCDTPYTSWHPEGTSMSLTEVLSTLEMYPSRYAVVTGGEPMIAPEIEALTEALRERAYHITIETAATVFKPVACDLASVSPKLANSTPWQEENGKYAERHEALRINPEVIQSFVEEYPYQLKFVIDSPEDLEELEILMGRLKGIDRTRVLLMPQSTTSEELNEKSHRISELCKTHGFRYGVRLHLDLYGNTRGT